MFTTSLSPTNQGKGPKKAIRETHTKRSKKNRKVKRSIELVVLDETREDNMEFFWPILIMADPDRVKINHRF
jgi:hypothetical protein